MLLSSSARTETLSEPAVYPKTPVMESNHHPQQASDLKRQFDAAVNVIRNLPSDQSAAKNGQDSHRPHHDP